MKDVIMEKNNIIALQQVIMQEADNMTTLTQSYFKH